MPATDFHGQNMKVNAKMARKINLKTLFIKLFSEIANRLLKTL